MLPCQHQGVVTRVSVRWPQPSPFPIPSAVVICQTVPRLHPTASTKHKQECPGLQHCIGCFTTASHYKLRTLQIISHSDTLLFLFMEHLSIEQALRLICRMAHAELAMKSSGSFEKYSFNVHIVSTFHIKGVKELQ